MPGDSPWQVDSPLLCPQGLQGPVAWAGDGARSWNSGFSGTLKWLSLALLLFMCVMFVLCMDAGLVTCMRESTCVPSHTCWGQRPTPGVRPCLPPCSGQGAFFVPAHTRLAGPCASWQSPVCASCLPVGSRGVLTWATTFDVGGIRTQVPGLNSKRFIC